MLQPGEAFQHELDYHGGALNDLEARKLRDEDQQAAIEEAQKRVEEQARSEARRIYKKHKRELDRLSKHAQGAVLEGNFEAYKYAIEKSRTILRQPYTDELIRVQWETTRRQIWEIVNGYRPG
ncbi:hypothetical protein CkP1_0058 [Citrobacter phage CkP1]|nr:hypothetical protein CkP1_0058 [Citrobacter phage CkP1]